MRKTTFGLMVLVIAVIVAMLTAQVALATTGGDGGTDPQVSSGGTGSSVTGGTSGTGTPATGAPMIAYGAIGSGLVGAGIFMLRNRRK